jgi:hypothetical protein
VKGAGVWGVTDRRGREDGRFGGVVGVVDVVAAVCAALVFVAFRLDGGSSDENPMDSLVALAGAFGIAFAGTSVTAMRSGGDTTGYVQKILVHIAPRADGDGALIRVRSRPRFHLTPFDMGRSLRNVEELSDLIAASPHRRP